MLLEKINNKKAIRSRNTTGDELTTTEKEVLRLICLEYNSEQIAKELGSSPATVKWHRNNIKGKINASNVTGLVNYAIKHKIHIID